LTRWGSTAVYGAFGAAAARVLGLDAAGVRHALGIVLGQVAGTTQTAVESPLSKHMQSGFAAKAGVLAALPPPTSSGAMC
jgi:2-methylcitrate dehydratase PrpD